MVAYSCFFFLILNGWYFVHNTERTLVKYKNAWGICQTILHYMVYLDSQCLASLKMFAIFNVRVQVSSRTWMKFKIFKTSFVTLLILLKKTNKQTNTQKTQVYSYLILKSGLLGSFVWVKVSALQAPFHFWKAWAMALCWSPSDKSWPEYLI